MNITYQNFSDMDSKSDMVYQTQNIFPSPEGNHIYCKCHFNKSYFMESYIFISKETRGKLTVHYHILSLQLFEQRKSILQYE